MAPNSVEASWRNQVYHYEKQDEVIANSTPTVSHS